MVVGRGNDAIPTWSGFNYQGKMMLLYVLELINQIAKDKNKDIDAYSVELEKTEDFCIICDSEYKSFHQVKAYLSKDKWNSYSKAMDKLLKHRVESNNPTAKCYLTVAKEIKDWDDASNTYNVSVELYKRASKVVGVCDVRNEIDTEILVYLKSKGYSDKAEEYPGTSLRRTGCGRRLSIFKGNDEPGIYRYRRDSKAVFADGIFQFQNRGTRIGKRADSGIFALLHDETGISTARPGRNISG